MIPIKKIRLLSLLIVESFICFGNKSEDYQSLKKEYYSVRSQWNSAVESAQKPNTFVAGSIYFLAGVVYCCGLLMCAAGQTKGLSYDFNRGSLEMPKHYQGIFGLNILISTAICVIGESISWRVCKVNEQDVICKKCGLFRAKYSEFEKLQKKIPQNVDLEDNKMSRLLEKIEKTRAEWKQKLDACKKLKFTEE
ncbi:MAG TPA: hypothetical protein VHO47_03650 [Candidatus Babeliales bacterium]|nr:hypothetical protein [Candidatus Babeliales bacterium]